MMRPPRSLVRRLRRAVDRVVSRNTTLRTERRRVRRSRKVDREILLVVRFGMMALIFGAFATMITGNDPTDERTVAQMAVLGSLASVWLLHLALLRVGQVRKLLTVPGELAVFYVNPVSNAQTFDNQCRQVLATSAWLIMDALAFGAAAAQRFGGGAPIWFGIVAFALAQWVACLSLVAILVQWAPPKLVARFTLGVWLLVIFIVAAYKFESPVLISTAVSLSGLVAKCTPGGWLVEGWSLIVLRQSTFGWLTLALAPILAVPGWLALRSLRASFSLEKVFGYQSDEMPDVFPEKPEEENAPAAEPSPPPLIPVAFNKVVAAALREKMDIAPGAGYGNDITWTTCAGLPLSPRQRVLLDALQLTRVSRTKLWMIIFFLLVGILEGQRLSILPEIAFAILLIGAAVMAVPFLLSFWVGFGPGPRSQFRVPIYAHFPVSFGEICRLHMKLAVPRCVAAVPLILMVVHIGDSPSTLSWMQALALATKIAYVLFVVQTVPLLYDFSKNSNDTQHGSLGALILLGGLIVTIVACVFLVIGFLGFNGGWPVLLAGMGLTVLCFGALGLYGWFYNRNFFDLVARS